VERRSRRHPRRLLSLINLAWVRTKTKIVHQAGIDKLRLSDQKIMIPRLASRLAPVGLFAKAHRSAQVRQARNIELHAFGSHDRAGFRAAIKAVALLGRRRCLQAVTRFAEAYGRD
jgi:hypothetical protein